METISTSEKIKRLEQELSQLRGQERAEKEDARKKAAEEADKELTAVENDGQKPKIFGSLQALRNLSMAMTGETIKDDYHNFGYMGKINGFDCFRIAGKNVPTNKLFVVGAVEKFIKIFDEGDVAEQII